jgi:tetratricopeptide (TPR) repeat protein
LGAARSGNAARAREDVVTLASIQKTLVDAREPYWADQVDIQRKAAEAWTLWAEGKKAEGIALLREAAAQEDKTDKSAVTPGPLAPARELLGEMLLAGGDAAGALAEFEATMKKEPNRFRAVLGGARAATKLARMDDATRYYRQLLDIARDADTERAEIKEARAFEAQIDRKVR